MTRIRFHQELDELKHRILAMAGMAEQAVGLAVQAYSQRDAALCQRVIASEAGINRAEREVDEFAIDLLAMQQPMAIDLRFILAVIKINADLERVGDQAVNIVQRVMNMIELPPSELPVDIPAMATQVGAMVRDALRSFIEGDPELAKSVLEADDEIDRALVVLGLVNPRAEDLELLPEDVEQADHRRRGEDCHHHDPAAQAGQPGHRRGTAG